MFLSWNFKPFFFGNINFQHFAFLSSYFPHKLLKLIKSTVVEEQKNSEISQIVLLKKKPFWGKNNQL